MKTKLSLLRVIRLNESELYFTWITLNGESLVCTYIGQEMDGSVSKPVLRLDTSYMVEKTYHDIAPYLGAFVAYLMPQ